MKAKHHLHPNAKRRKVTSKYYAEDRRSSNAILQDHQDDAQDPLIQQVPFIDPSSMHVQVCA